MQISAGKVLQNSVSRDAKKGLKQVADINCNAFLCPYFTFGATF